MPIFKATQRTDVGLRGTVSCAFVEINGQRQRIVGDGDLGFLLNQRAVHEGHWQISESGWTFVPSAGVIPVDVMEFSILDYYWGSRVQLVLETSLCWEKATMTADSHDHCAICWKSLEGLTESAEHYAATGHDDVRYHSTERTCVNCYEKHVSQNDISFVPTFDPSPPG